MLRALQTPRGVWELIDKQDYCLAEFVEELRKLKEEGLIREAGGKLELTERGRNALSLIGGKYEDFTCDRCEGRGILMEGDVTVKFSEICRERPQPVEKYDQGYMRVQDALARVAFMIERGDLDGCKIIIVGDDDLVGIAASLTNLPKLVKVLEIDERIVEFENRVAEEHGLRLEAEVYDVRDEIKDKGFDVFVTDPVETVDGIKLFLSRCASALSGRGSSGYFGLGHIESSLRKWYRVEQMLLQMGMVITDIRRKFSTYPNVLPLDSCDIVRQIKDIFPCATAPDYDFYKSSLIRVECVEDPRPLVRGRVELGEELYLDEEALATPRLGKLEI